MGRARDHSLGRRYSLSIEEILQAVVGAMGMVALVATAGACVRHVVFDSCTLSDGHSVTPPSTIKNGYDHYGQGVPKVEESPSRIQCIYYHAPLWL